MVKISIIVPVYNVEKYLEKCLSSLVQQHLQEIEIIVVNDGSTDSSAQIIEDFHKKHPEKILSLTKKNGGLSDARNFGLAQASGNYIGFVDADDEVSAEMFSEMYALAKKHDADIVMCGLLKVDEKGNAIEELPQMPNKTEVIALSEDFSAFGEIGYFACNKIFKRALFSEKRFKKEVHFEDIQLIPQLLLESKTIAQTPHLHYRYLVRAHSISKTHTARGLDILRAVADVENAFHQSNYAENLQDLRNFQILQGVYSFLAYLAFVKDESCYNEMSADLKKFIKDRQIRTVDLLLYRRFEKNYLLSLPLRKKIYYLLYFFGLEKLLRNLTQKLS